MLSYRVAGIIVGFLGYKLTSTGIGNILIDFHRISYYFGWTRVPPFASYLFVIFGILLLVLALCLIAKHDED